MRLNMLKDPYDPLFSKSGEFDCYTEIFTVFSICYAKSLFSTDASCTKTVISDFKQFIIIHVKYVHLSKAKRTFLGDNIEKIFFSVI